MDLQTIQVVFWLLLVATIFMAYEIRESLKAPVCPECYHCKSKLEEDRRRQAEAREAFARSFQRDRDEDGRPR